MEMMRRGVPTGNTATQIGIRIPNVPHEVPVAKARKQAVTKITAGSSVCRPVPSIKCATYEAASSESVIDFSVQANARMRMAGTIASKPFIKQLMASSKVITRRDTSQMPVRISAVSEPITSPIDALLAAKAAMKSW